MPAVAITDHGNMHGAYDFYKQAKAAGVTPVIGVEAYVAPESRLTRSRVKWGRPEQKGDDVSGNGAIHPHDDWARNAAGLHNLFRLNSRASIEGHYVKWPRMDLELIAEHAEGIMATTGCPSGEVQTRLRLGQFDEALRGRREVPGDLRQGQLLPRDHGPRARHRAAGPRRPDRHRPQARHPAGGHQRLALHARGAGRGARRAAVRADRQQHRRPQPVPVRRRAATTSSRPTRCARSTPPTCGWRAAATRCSWRSGSTPTGMFTCNNLMPRFPVPGRARPRRPGSARRSGRGCAAASRAASREEHRRQAEYEIGVIMPDGLPVVLPGGRRLHPVGQEQRASRSARAVARRRAAWSPTRWASPTSTRCRTG